MSKDVQTVGELREHLMDKATTDLDFRAQLIADPKAAIKNELGLEIPGGFTIKVHEDQPETSHLVLPPAATLGEEDLERAAGGATYLWSDRHGGRFVRTDSLATFWDDVNGPTYYKYGQQVDGPDD